ncbi:hypothetical protein FOA52_011354 [Chlamydomonas sp. UWO 241]|nr:hypothetical protein FOA52_011354 [Chlamydomonas sp. UWO 241]
MLHIVLRYMTSPSLDPASQTVWVRGAMAVDPQPYVPHVRANKREAFDPPHVKVNPHLRLTEAAADVEGGHASHALYGDIQFPVGPVVQTAMVGELHAKFTLPRNQTSHDYVLSGGLGEGASCVFRPGSVPNRLDSRGLNVAPEMDEGQQPTEAVAVFKPPYNVDAAFTALLARHIEHHVVLGFSSYLVYVLPRHADAFLACPALRPWLGAGVMHLVVWSAVPEHAGMPLWDQRLVYNHAVLAHIGRPVLLLMGDLDEFLVPTRPGVSTVFDMLSACAPSAPNNLALQRRHVLAAGWGDRAKPEAPLWWSSSGPDPAAAGDVASVSGVPFESDSMASASDASFEGSSMTSDSGAAFEGDSMAIDSGAAFEGSLMASDSGMSASYGAHPLDAYTLIAWSPRNALAPKAAVNPNFVRLFYIHHASSLKASEVRAWRAALRMRTLRGATDKTSVDVSCALLAHVCNMWGNRLPTYGVKESSFTEEDTWGQAQGQGQGQGQGQHPGADAALVALVVQAQHLEQHQG